MKKFVLVLVSVFSFCFSQGQYYEWAKGLAPNALKGRYPVDLDVDKNNNAYFYNYSRLPGQAPPSCFINITKFNSNGDSIWEYKTPDHFTGATFIGGKVDNLGNYYFLGKNSGAWNEVYIGADTIKLDSAFLFKISTNGNLIWVKSFFYKGYNSIEIDTNNNIILTGTIQTQKRNKQGNVIWTKTNTTGSDIGITKSNAVYVLGTTQIRKINSSDGSLIWTKNNYNASKMAVKSTGEVFLINSDSLIKLNSAGNLSWIKTNITASEIDVDSLGRTVLIQNDSTICRVSSNGAMQQWAISGRNVAFKKVKIDRVGNIVTCGEYNQLISGELCPFQLPFYCVQYTAAVFVSKINSSSTMPFQAATYLPSLGGGMAFQFCSGKKYSVAFDYCTNSVSSFNPGNEFVVQLSDINGSFNTAINLGRPDSFLFPKNLPVGISHDSRLRIVSTSPFVAGYVNLPNNSIAFDCIPYFIVVNNSTSISKSYTNSYCYDSTVVLTASTSNYLCSYSWLKNGLEIPGATSSTYSTNLPGNYCLVATYLNCDCFDTSNVINVGYVQPAHIGISASSAISFCQDSSVILTTTTTNGICSYAWHRNGVPIAGATQSSYTATQTGNYKLVVVNLNCNCTDTSNVINVTVNPLPAATITASGATTFCAGDSVVLSANTGIGLDYQWRVYSAKIPFEVNPTYTAKQTGVYRVRIKDSKGCTKMSNAISVSVTCKLNGDSQITENEKEVVPAISDGFFQINSGDKIIEEIELYNLLGTKVYSEKVNTQNQNLQVDYSAMPNGVYMIRLVSDQDYYSQKISICH